MAHVVAYINSYHKVLDKEQGLNLKVKDTEYSMQIKVPKKQYKKPKGFHELDLETKAGSPLGNPIDPINLGSPEE